METLTSNPAPSPEEEPRDCFATGTLEVGLAPDAGLRWAVVDLGKVVEEARERRDLSPVSAVALGQTMAAAVLLLRMFAKTPQGVTLEVDGDGELGRIVAETDVAGSLRGMVAGPRVDLPKGQPLQERVAEAIGRGSLRVIRHLAKGSYDSRVHLEGRGLSQNLAHFLAQSQQIRSAVVLGALPAPEGIQAAGGCIVEALPGADEDVLRQLEVRLADGVDVSRALAEGGANGLLDSVLGELERGRLEEHRICYRCRCDRDRLRQQIAGFSQQDRHYLFEDEGGRTRDWAQLDCTFCGARYVFEPGELDPSPEQS